MKHYVLVIVFCIAALSSYGQINPEKKLGTWYMFFGTHQVSEKLSFNTGMQFRYYKLITNYNLNLLSTGINYKINSNTYFSFNYAYLDIDRSIEFSNITNTIEHRFWEQISYNHKLRTIQINHRLRLEHRFLHEINDNSVQNRIRYRLGTPIKLNRAFYINISNEFFLSFEGKSFRENRLYSGIGIIIDKNVKLQLGYMNQHINSLNLDRLQFGVYLKTDLRIKTTH